MLTKQLDGELIRLFADQASWMRWLKRYSEKQTGIWLRFARPRSMFTSLSYQEAVEAALLFDWLARERKKESEQTWIRRFSPRTRALATSNPDSEDKQT